MSRRVRFEFGIGLAGEAGHDVGADRGGGMAARNFLNFFAIVPGSIFAMHAAQDGIAAGLQGDMGMLGDARRSGGRVQ